MENQSEKKMETEMETREYVAIVRVCIGVICRLTALTAMTAA